MILPAKRAFRSDRGAAGLDLLDVVGCGADRADPTAKVALNDGAMGSDFFAAMAVHRSDRTGDYKPSHQDSAETDPLPSTRPATLYEVSDTPQAAITLTDKAAEKIGELLGSQPDGAEQALRVAVRGGGCSGFQYALAFDKAKEDDNVFEVDGVAVIVDKVSMQFVFGSEVDYVEGLQGAGFQVNNPNVVAACGCGSSFRVAEDEEVSAV